MRGHIRRRGRSWSIVLDTGRDSETGRRKQKWVSGFRTKGEAEDELAVLLGKLRRDENIDPDKTPLEEYLTEWLDRRVGELAPLSVTQYRSVIKNHVKPSPLAKMPIGKIRRAHARTFEQTLAGGKLAASTRNVVRAVLSRALSDAVADDLIGSNPFDGVRRQRAEPRAGKPKTITAWTVDELRDLLNVTAEDRLAALWRVAVATGARRGELLGLTWLGYSAERRTLEISQQVTPTRGGVSIAPCKTRGSHRTITLDQDTIADLERHRERQLIEREAAGGAYEDRDLVFCDEFGRPINPQRLTEAFGKHRTAAKIRPGRLHDVRHSVATQLLTRGVPVHVVSKRLGHATPMITLTVYAHVLPSSDQQAADVMAIALSEAS